MENNISKLNNFLILLNKICQQIFSVFLIGYLFFFLMDSVFDDFMSNFINLNYLLIIVVISGLITAIFGNEKTLRVYKGQTISPKFINLICFGLALLAVVVIFVKIYSFGIILSLIISILSGILIWLISYLFLTSAD